MFKKTTTNDKPYKPMNSQERERELKELENALADLRLGINIDDIDFDNYERIFQQAKTSAEIEQPNVPENLQISTARQNAIKLTLAFKTITQANEYLSRFKTIYPNSTQIMHDACLFNLPRKNKWNISLWQEIISQQKPGSPADYIMRILPLICKVEEYVEKNREKLVNTIEDNVRSGYEQRFASEFDKISVEGYESFREKLVNQMMTEKLSLINKGVKNEFSSYLLSQLGFASGKPLSKENLEKLKFRKENLKDSDIDEQETLKLKWTNKYRVIVETKINTEYPKIDTISMHEYIKYRMNEHERVINTIIKDKSQNILSVSTPISTIKEYLKDQIYQRAHENPKAAELFFQHDMPEELFNQYLSLIPQNDNASIPDVIINGEEIDKAYSEFYLCKLDPDDPRCAI
jgi:hypothetical protein